MKVNEPREGLQKKSCGIKKGTKFIVILIVRLAYAQEEGLQYYFVIAIVDKNLMGQDPIRRKEWGALMSPAVIYKSLPHLNDGELKEIARHYAGVTTWEDIIERFGLKSTILLH